MAILAMGAVEEFSLSWQGILLPPILTPVGYAILMLLANLGGSDDWVGIVFSAAVGWLYYILLTTWSLRARRRRVFVAIFTLLCISLILNVAGCEAMKHTHLNCNLEPKNRQFMVCQAGADRLH